TPAETKINEESSLQLRAYQQEDVKFLSPQKSIGIFNEMRTGKTPTALAIFKAQGIVFCAIIDEAHFLRNCQSQQSKSIYTLKDSEYKMALTGTPIVNHSKSEISTKNRTFTIKKVIGFKSEKAKQELQKRINQISVARKQKE
ncbi:2319_t:CDS:2, partial [Funneliformis geosporum]